MVCPGLGPFEFLWEHGGLLQLCPVSRHSYSCKGARGPSEDLGGRRDYLPTL